MALGYKDLLARAEARVHSVTPAEAQALTAAGAVIVDIRDPRELEREGRIPDSCHAPRGMLEFWIDPESPYHKPWLAGEGLFIFHCASGWRSLLAAEIAQEMGLKTASMTGGFTDWRKAGLPVEGRAPADQGSAGAQGPKGS